MAKNDQNQDSMDRLLKMMAGLTSQMDAQSQELKELKAKGPALPEAIVSLDDMAKRKEHCNAVLHEQVESQKEKLMFAYGYTPAEKQEGIDPYGEMVSHYRTTDMTANREVVRQLAWSGATSCARQYMYCRFRADENYLTMTRLSDQYGIHFRRNTDGVSGAVEHDEVQQPGQEQHDRAEQAYHYHIESALQYEILRHAFREIWDEIDDEKRDEAMVRNPEWAYDSKPPTDDVSEAGYTQYLEKRASAALRDMSRDKAAMMESSRLLYTTSVLDKKYGPQSAEDSAE